MLWAASWAPGFSKSAQSEAPEICFSCFFRNYVEFGRHLRAHGIQQGVAVAEAETEVGVVAMAVAVTRTVARPFA
jgi:hypothetical protein